MPGGGVPRLGLPPGGGRVLVPRSPARGWTGAFTVSLVLDSLTISQATMATTGTAKNSSHERRVRRRLFPPWSGLLIRVVSQGAHHAEAEQGQDDRGQDHPPVQPVVDEHRDLECADDDHHDHHRHECEAMIAVQYTGNRLWRS